MRRSLLISISWKNFINTDSSEVRSSIPHQICSLMHCIGNISQRSPKNLRGTFRSSGPYSPFSLIRSLSPHDCSADTIAADGEEVEWKRKEFLRLIAHSLLTQSTVLVSNKEER